MVTKVKGGVLDESALSGKNMTGDIAFDTTTLKIDSSNNRVGIGTASPAALLHLSGDSDNSDEACQIIINDEDSTAGSGVPSIQFKRNNTNTGRIRGTDTQGIIMSGSSAQGDDLVVQEGNVGIGLTTPSDYYAPNLVVSSAAEKGITIAATATNAANYLMFADGTSGDERYRGYLGYNHSSDELTLRSADFINFMSGGGSERMRIDSGGNIGFNTTNTTVGSSVTGNSTATPSRFMFNNNYSNGYTDASLKIYLFNEGSTRQGFTSGPAYDLQYHSSGSDNGRHAFYVANTEVMRVNKGKVAIGTSGLNYSFVSTGIDIEAGTSPAITMNRNSDGDIITFKKDNGTGTVGTISITSTATTYNTSSDARLKNILGEAKGLEIINKLNPVNFEWKKNKEIQDGLIAQEVMEIVPNAVTGSEEDYYQMDYSKLVTPLIKAIQEQQTIIEDLKSRVKTLES